MAQLLFILWTNQAALPNSSSTTSHDLDTRHLGKAGWCWARGQATWSRRAPWAFRLPIKSFLVLDLATVTSTTSSSGNYIYWQLD